MAGIITSDPGVSPDVAQEGVSGIAAGAFEGQNWFGDSKQIARGIGNAAATLGTVDDFGRPITLPEPKVDPDALNHRYGVEPQSGFKGLHFDSAVPESVAKSMYQAKLDEISRNATAQRSSGFGHGLAGFAVGMLDPVNIAAAFMPVMGEARMAGMLGRVGIEGLEDGGPAARTALRTATGAVNGGVSQAPLIALRYGLSRQEQSDYDMSDAAADVVMGSLLGGGLHAVGGAVGDWLGVTFRKTDAARTLDASPDAREAAARTAVAAVAEDRPVDVAPVTSFYGPLSEPEHRLMQLGVEEAGLQAQDAAHVSTRDSLPAGDMESRLILSRVRQIEQQMQADGVAPDDLRDLTAQRDALLARTTPEKLQEAAASIEQRLQIVQQRGGIADRLKQIEQERAQIIQEHAIPDTMQRPQDIAAEWQARQAQTVAQISKSEAVRQARGGAPRETERTAAEAETAAKAPEPPRPEMPPEIKAEDIARQLTEPYVTKLDGAWVRSAGETGEGFDMNRGGAALSSRVKAALDRGDKVTLHVEGKEVPITSVERGMIRDAGGKPWGATPLALSKTDHVTIESKGFAHDLLTPDERAEYDAMGDAAKNAEGEAKAYETAGVCLALGSFGNG